MAVHSPAESGALDRDHVLGDEHEHSAVPPKARRGTVSVSMAWIGFPAIISGAMTGSILLAGMGFARALWAMPFVYLLMQQQDWLAALAFVFLFCKLGSVCAHCLCNTAAGCSRIVNTTMRPFAVPPAAAGSRA